MILDQSTRIVHASTDLLPQLVAAAPAAVDPDPAVVVELPPVVLEQEPVAATAGCRSALLLDGMELDHHTRTRLRAWACTHLTIPLDGADAAAHDARRGLAGSFAWAIGLLERARHLGLSTTVVSHVVAPSVEALDRLARIPRWLGAQAWLVRCTSAADRPGHHEAGARGDAVRTLAARLRAIGADLRLPIGLRWRTRERWWGMRTDRCVPIAALATARPEAQRSGREPVPPAEPRAPAWHSRTGAVVMPC